MNIIPLVLALVLMLSVLTIEKLEKFKNQTIVQNQYQLFFQKGEREVFNQRQKKLYHWSETSHRQLTFRYFLDQNARKSNFNAAKQFRFLIIDLMKILYGDASFYKNLEKNRPNFIEEMLDAIQNAADEAPQGMIKRVEDIARIHLEDPELQKAFYFMLKGSITRDELYKITDISPRIKEKAYVSILTFINYNGKAEKEDSARIIVQLAPREILKAIFQKDEIVESIIVRRNELAANKNSGSQQAFENEFKDKRRPDIEDKLLDFRITSTGKREYD